MSFPAAVLVLASSLALLPGPAAADGAWRTHVVTPQFVSPAELSAALGARDLDGRVVVTWAEGPVRREVGLRRNDPANRLVLDGTHDDVEALLGQIAMFDVAPRQISLEARIVEVDTDAASDLGIDWAAIRSSASANWRGEYRADERRLKYSSGGFSGSTKDETDSDYGFSSLSLGATLTDALHLLEEKGAASYHDAPRLLTLNNQPATVLDGYRVTYVNRANGYANIHQTETMDAGLRLEVTPSLVESGYLRLTLEAEMSNLLQVEMIGYPNSTRDFTSVSGSPVKHGQIVRNTVMAKDGETIVLAGFTRNVDVRTRRRFPVLGVILPFLFSREIATERHRESLIVITPRVVDLAGNLDKHDEWMLKGK